jgi:hypothetical protein
VNETPPVAPGREPGALPGAAGEKPRASCGTCRHFTDDPAELERIFVGIGALSSAWGSTRGRAGICAKDDSFHDPIPACSEFEAQGAGRFAIGQEDRNG